LETIDYDGPEQGLALGGGWEFRYGALNAGQLYCTTNEVVLVDSLVMNNDQNQARLLADGRLISSSNRGRVLLWDAENARVVASLNTSRLSERRRAYKKADIGHGVRVGVLDFAVLGDRVLVLFDDGQGVVWNLPKTTTHQHVSHGGKLGARPQSGPIRLFTDNNKVGAFKGRGPALGVWVGPSRVIAQKVDPEAGTITTNHGILELYSGNQRSSFLHRVSGKGALVHE
jgi:WD40 repeat protein